MESTSNQTVAANTQQPVVTNLLFDDMYHPPNDDPFLTVLNYSGGRQSHKLARQILRSEIEIPTRFLVVAADPGNEHKDTIRIRDKTFAEFNDRGIHAVVCPGPKMLDELRTKKCNGSTHIDQPPLWNSGALPQHCTRHYKIRPMNRVIKAYLRYTLGYEIPWVDTSPGFVERWIGFTWDELNRRRKTLKKWGSEPEDKWQQPRFPCIERCETKADVLRWYEITGEEMPPPSVCGHCPANGVATLKRIHDTDQTCWSNSVEYDGLGRDMRQFGVREKCFCSATRLPLVELKARNFEVVGSDSQDMMCDSGACFI